MATVAVIVAASLPLTAPAQEKADAARAANTVILTETGVRNLGIETVEVVETDFEETVFALGRIEVIPSRRGVVSSRIPGRILEIRAFEGDRVSAGDLLVRVESRQPGDPPPTIDLKAPIGGMIASAHASIGDPVDPEMHILEIIDLSEAYAVARVPEDQAGLMKPGTAARITIAALPEKTFEGELLRFGTAADRESGTIDAVFHLAGLGADARPEMRAEFSIVLSRRENVMAVPREALQGDSTNRFVFVKDFQLANAFVKAPVRTGARNDRYVEILGGLFPGDEVVTRGAYPLVYAGGGGVSLKEALDAAHGHEHNEDGSELTPQQKAQKNVGNPAGGNPAAHGAAAGPLTLFLAILSGLLAILLVLSALWRRSASASADRHA